MATTTKPPRLSGQAILTKRPMSFQTTDQVKVKNDRDKDSLFIDEERSTQKQILIGKGLLMRRQALKDKGTWAKR